MSALVRYDDRPDVVLEPRGRSWVELMAPAAELAKAIAPTDFVPRAMRHNAPAITACILYGDEIGLGPMQSLATVKMVDGTPTLLAKIQRALVLAAGHAIWPEDLTTTRATWCGRRAGTDEVTRVTWTIDDARRAHLDGKPNYKTYPRQMLSARASAELVGAIFGDVVGGLVATEEAAESADADAAASGASPAPARSTRRRRGAVAVAAPQDVPQPAVVAALPPLPGEIGDRGVLADAPAVADAELLTSAQLRRLQKAYRAVGFGGSTALDRARRHDLAEQTLGVPIGSSADLTTAQASTLIEHLEARREQLDDEGELPDGDPAGLEAPDDAEQQALDV